MGGFAEEGGAPFGRYFVMTTSRWLHVEQGAAFAQLEAEAVRALEDTPSRGKRNMTRSTEASTSEEHAAPRQAWDGIADAYDAHVADGEAALATEALLLAGLKAGDHFLDVAAGTGGLSLPALRLGAGVVATDWSPKMIERFEARVRGEGLEGAHGYVMDCHALDFPDATFDVTGSQFGVMLVPSQPQALAEMVRVTRPGGRVLLVAYGSPSEFEALQAFIAALRSVVPDFPGLPDDPPPLEFQVSDPNVMRQRLEESGLVDVQVSSTHRERIEVDSGQQLWDWCLGGNPIPGMLVADLTDDQRHAMCRVLDRAVLERAGDQPVAEFTAPVNIGVGTRQ